MAFRRRLFRIAFSFIFLGLLIAQATGGISDASSLRGLLLTWQRDPTTTMTIDWHLTTLGHLDGCHPCVRYRLEGDAGWRRADGEELRPALLPDRTRYRVELIGLVPDSVYEFQLSGDVETYRFRTMPTDLDEPLRFAIGGDTRHRQDWMEEMNRTAMAYDPAFIVWGGDLAYANGETTGRWVEWYDAILNTLISKDGFVVPVITGIGNHEVRQGYYRNHPGFEETDAWRSRIAPFFYGLLAFPGQPGYGALDFGDYLSLIVLDTAHTNSITGAQKDWLVQALSEREHVRHILPVYHVPAYPSVRASGSRDVLDHWIPLFEEVGVRVAFENHDHAYKRTVPILSGQYHPRGIVYLGDGSWGVTPRDVHPPGERWYLARAETIRAGMIVTLSEGNIHILGVSHRGAVIDEYTVVIDASIESPRDGAVVGPHERLEVRIDPDLDVVDVRIEQNGNEIYRGASIPDGIRLDGTAGLREDDVNHLTVSITDANSRTINLESRYFMRHVFIQNPGESERVQGDLSVVADVSGRAEDLTSRYALTLYPIHALERGAGRIIDEGKAWPGVARFDSKEFDDGAYDIELLVENESGPLYSDARRIVVRNWEELIEFFEPPQSIPLFGLELDRLKTKERTDGWKHVTDRDQDFLGDESRLVPAGSSEYLIWEQPRLRRFDVTVFARHPAVIEGLAFAASPDSEDWELLEYSVEEIERSGAGWLKLSLRGQVPKGLDAGYIRLSWDGSKADGEQVQLGHAVFVGSSH